MKLIIMRHCEAVSDAASDHARPLTALGEAQAAELGRKLANAGIEVDGCICSDALRTKMTWAGVVEGMRCANDIPVHFTRCLYNAGVADIRAQLTAHAVGTTMVVVGHNPGFSRAVEQLSGTTVRLSVGNAALIEIPDGDWAQAIWSAGKLTSRFDGDEG